MGQYLSLLIKEDRRRIRYHVTKNIDGIIETNTIFSAIYLFPNLDVQRGSKKFNEYLIQMENSGEIRNECIRSYQYLYHIYITSSLLYTFHKYHKIKKRFKRKGIPISHIAILKLSIPDKLLVQKGYFKAMIPNHLGNINYYLKGLYGNPIDLIMNNNAQLNQNQ